MNNQIARLWLVRLVGLTVMTAGLAPAYGQATVTPADLVPRFSEDDENPRRQSRWFPRLRNVQDPGVLFNWPGQRDGKIEGLDEGIVTDRPDFTEASSVVGRGVLQIESGYTYSRARASNNSLQSNSYPETLFRYGFLADWLELRFYPNFAADEANGIRRSGAQDLYLGMKIGLTAQDGILPEMALTPQMTVPTGSDEFTSDRTLAGANWLYGWNVTERLGIGGSTQFNRRFDDSVGEYSEGATSLTANYAITERLGHYSEWFALIPINTSAVPDEHYFDGGFTYGLSNDVQWDIRGGVGLNDDADDYFVGTGLSVRFQ